MTPSQVIALVAAIGAIIGAIASVRSVSQEPAAYRRFERWTTIQEELATADPTSPQARAAVQAEARLAIFDFTLLERTHHLRVGAGFVDGGALAITFVIALNAVIRGEPAWFVATVVAALITIAWIAVVSVAVDRRTAQVRRALAVEFGWTELADVKEVRKRADALVDELAAKPLPDLPASS